MLDIKPRYGKSQGNPGKKQDEIRKIMTTDFYADLPVFEEFSEFSDFSSYTNVPDDWVVVISDVVGSTKAISEGRYKDVNMVGAASITTVLNACGDTQVPFVFGGDGGTVVVPPELSDVASNALCALKNKSQEIFGLELRAGAIPVSDLRKDGASVKIRKFELSKGNFLAMFAGGGMERADQLLKSQMEPNPYVLNSGPETGEPDLEGLSCRWEPLKATKGKMLTMMIKAMADNPRDERKLLSQIMAAIEKELGEEARKAAPVNKKSLRFRWPPQGLLREARMGDGDKPYWRRLSWVVFTSLVQLWCERFGTSFGGYDAKKYGQEMQTNTDFRKFDGILRMVLDVSDRQVEKIDQYLAGELADGKLVYGMHVADTALMTCMVFSLEQSEHVHFVDGSNGGFAMAAVDFKRRMSQLGTG